ncbi:MAG: sensor histidine kinase [Chitinophagaceae bacterium]|nr:sensor histidine kinase [Chitinophagaceae bacterium]MCA6496649.1 sensor histidine kinase [Chitinophagaceae bacterium]
MLLRPVLFFLAGIFLPLSFLGAQQTQIQITGDRQSSVLAENIEFLEDDTNKMSAEDVLKNDKFQRTSNQIPVFQINVKNAWFKMDVANQSASNSLFLDIAYSNLSKVTLYRIDSGKANMLAIDGNAVATDSVQRKTTHFIFDLQLPQGSKGSYLLHINSEHPIIIPASIHTYESLNETLNTQTLVAGIYMGVMLVMFLYNLFIFSATRDRNYLLYIFYIFFLTLAQSTLAGYGFRFLWPDYPSINHYAVVVTSSLSAISGLLFTMQFLQTAVNSNLYHRIMQGLIAIYFLGMGICLFTSYLPVSYVILNINGILVVITILGTCIYLIKQRYRPAIFYIIAWIFFLFAFLILILRNFAILPYNNFTTYSLYVGSSFEVALLAIALADKINNLRREKELSQAESLRTLQENEKLIINQNSLLEKKVSERTDELLKSNESLHSAMEELKDAQIQLVDAEKMASLGQLTAGIAHEINNPINFVKSNIGPLQMDIDDLVSIIDAYKPLHDMAPEEMPEKLKEVKKLKDKIDIEYLKSEVDNLVSGIRDGAERTVEIVKGLRTFSRLDEGEIKTVNIYEGLDSTIVLLRNMLNENIIIEKDYQADGVIECFPGKLNQVFMNIISNAIHAIKLKNERHEKNYIRIFSRDVDGQLELHIKDTGVGMSEEVKRKIFDPFFTTKEVGEGTGLGLSIVYKIIFMHYGKIDVITSPGNGAEFVITLNYLLPAAINK